MSHVTFEHIKDTDNSLAGTISHPKSIHLYHTSDLEGEGNEFGHDMSEKLPHIHAETPTHIKQSDPINTESPAQVEQKWNYVAWNTTCTT